MEKKYNRGDVIEYLGVRYYVIENDEDSWLCIDGYSFNITVILKTNSIMLLTL